MFSMCLLYWMNICVYTWESGLRLLDQTVALHLPTVAFKLQYYFVCVFIPVFVCVYAWLGGWGHWRRGQAELPVKWITWPDILVAEGSLSSFLSNSLAPSPLKPFFFFLSTCLYGICALICMRFFKEARVGGTLQEESRTCQANHRGNSTGSHGAGEPTEGEPGPGWVKNGSILGGLGSNNKAGEEGKFGTKRRAQRCQITSGGQEWKRGWMKVKEGETKKQTARDAKGSRESLSQPEGVV